MARTSLEGLPTYRFWNSLSRLLVSEGEVAEASNLEDARETIQNLLRVLSEDLNIGMEGFIFETYLSKADTAVALLRRSKSREDKKQAKILATELPQLRQRAKEKQQVYYAKRMGL